MKNKITIDRELFFSKLSKAIKFVSTKSIIPAFENFLLIVNGNNMQIIATDGSIQVKLNCQVEATNDFAVCINAKWLIGNVALYRENEVTITMKDEKKVEMKCGKSKGNITTDCLPDHYTVMKMEETDSEIIITQSLLKTGLKSAEKFVEEDNQNANMVAINITEIDNRIVFTGLTQQYMCRVATRPLSIAKWNPINIPTATANKVVSLLADKGEVTVVHSKDKICFFTGQGSDEVFEIMSVTAAVKFPNSENLFKKKPVNTLVLNTLEFKDAVKRLKIYAEPGMAAKLTMEFEEIMGVNELKMSAQDTLTGRFGEEHMTFSDHQGIPIHKSYANDHFLEILSLVESKEFIFHFAEDRTPSFVIPKVANPEEDIFSFLIANQSV